eukprot:TRINITY_DN8690_c0_g1_i1.p1 TRINITY_DN8690_c0_g1~~TRINITY_DN8690_c0_g1_i1.p1  ORF type:complete len:160 (-),score=3.48 TRINITY_DN8690_c0_g1_i1:77-556(-)
MATTSSPFRKTPPPAPPCVAPAVEPSTPQAAAPPSSDHVAAPAPAMPARADNDGTDTAAAVRSSTPAVDLAAAAEMFPAADKTNGEQPVSKKSRDDYPACTSRPKYGPSAPIISKAQLRRGLRIIYTQCKLLQMVSSNVKMCLDSCPCPWARRPSQQPG